VSTYKAFEVREETEKNFVGTIVEKSALELAEGSVSIEVCYSSVNYKDALSASGSKAVTREYPHVPGIDAAGTVLASTDSNFAVGDEVVVTGYDLGMNTAGGFGQQVTVPGGWVTKLPVGLSLRDSMVLGTAGLTAGLCVNKLLLNGITPEAGKVLVTGATGGVGIIACALLVKLGFEVVASTGKLAETAKLTALGVSEVISREAFSEENPRPMLKESYAAAVDVAGGTTLVNVIKSLSYGGSVAACGLVDSPALSATVLPFILRGVNLLGVDSVELPLAQKQQVWNLFANEWALTDIDSLAETIVLAELPAVLAKVLAGGAIGRYVLETTLVNVIKSLSYGGSVAACGLVDSPALSATVLPFILRGVNLLGVDSVELPLAQKQQVWNLFANEWALTDIDSLAETIVLAELPAVLAKVLAGGAIGRYVLDLRA